MAQARRSRKERGTAQGRLELVGLGDRERPPVELALVEPGGERKRLELSADGSFALDEKLLGKGFALEVGSPELGEPRRYRYDPVFEQLQKNQLLRIPEGAWSRWIPLLTCVTGRVRVCRFRRPWELSVGTVVRQLGLKAALVDINQPQLPRPFFPICRPVCQGRVEVFVRTCCCPPITILDPPIVIRHICEIIDCREIVFPREPIDPRDPVGPRPGPGPDPAPLLAMKALRPAPELELTERGEPDLDVLDAPLQALHSGVERAVVRAIKRAEAEEGSLQAPEILRLAGHLTALLQLSPAERVGYLERFPELHRPICHCSTTKVDEVTLQTDGHFDSCFRMPLVTRRGCSRRVLYRVSQFQSGAWVVIYDDFATGRSHELSEDAVLDADTRAHACDDDGHEWGPRPFALLERIGDNYHANRLIHSTDQADEDSWTAPFQATDGLVNPPPAGPPPGVTAGPYNQPWGASLGLRYAFHPGLAGIGAAFYRTRAFRLNAAGNPIAGSEVLFDDALSWGRYITDATGVHIEWVPLQQATINGVDGLYAIPDTTSTWLDKQYHAYMHTAAEVGGVPRMPGGRYIFVLDLFDAAGERLIPDSAPAGPGPDDHTPAVAFDYRRLTGPLDVPFTNTAVAPHRALGNLFLVDNLPAFADIEAIVHNGSASATNCQFLVGPKDDDVALRYSAYQSTGYQWYHQITIKQGLTGPTSTPVTSSANVFSGNSPNQEFQDLLRPPGFAPETKCAFAAGLVARVRHTNGSGRLTGYDRSDTAAFALEISPP